MIKKFYQKDIAYAIIMAFPLLFFLGLVVFCVMEKAYVLAVIILIFTLYTFLQIWCYRVDFEEDKITTIKITKWFKVKKRTISYSSIESIRLVVSRLNDERNKVSAIASCPYLEFNQGSFVRFWMDVKGFSKKQVMEMLEIIGAKTGLNYTVEELLKNKSGNAF